MVRYPKQASTGTVSLPWKFPSEKPGPVCLVHCVIFILTSIAMPGTLGIQYTLVDPSKLIAECMPLHTAADSAESGSPSRELGTLGGLGLSAWTRRQLPPGPHGQSGRGGGLSRAERLVSRQVNGGLWEKGGHPAWPRVRTIPGEDGGTGRVRAPQTSGKWWPSRRRVFRSQAWPSASCGNPGSRETACLRLPSVTVTARRPQQHRLPPC